MLLHALLIEFLFSGPANVVLVLMLLDDPATRFVVVTFIEA
jgi:hypothetical protein